MILSRLSAALFAALSLSVATAPQPASAQAPKRIDAPFVPTPQSTVEMMLRVAGVGPGDVHYDLGSGDGRISITAVKDFGATRSIGIDIDPERVRDGIENAAKAGVSDRVRFVRDDVFKADFSDATVVTMYLLQHLNLELRPRLLSMLRPGTRLVSYEFHLGEWEADTILTPAERLVQTREIVSDDETLLVYFWTVPAPVAGRWEWQAGGERYQLDLKQEFQKVSGTLRAFGQETPIKNASLRGTAFRFEAGVMRDGRPALLRFDSKVSGDAVEGTVDVDGASAPLAGKKL